MPRVSDYASLAQALIDFSHRSSLSTYQDYFIQDGEDRIYRKILELNEGKGLRWMETKFPSSPITNGTLTVPTDWLAPKDFQVIDTDDCAYPLQFRDVQWIYANYPDRSATDCPSYIARDSQSSSPALTPLVFVASANQTAFSLSAAPANASIVFVTLDGVVLLPTDYSVASGTLTLTSGAVAGQTLVVQYLWASSYILSAALTSTATAGQTGFDISAAPSGAQILYVTLDGVIQTTPNDYTVSGTTLTLTTGANAGQVLLVQYVTSITSSNAGSFIFGPYPDTNYTVQGTYYQKATALSATNTTTWMTAQIPTAFLAACMVSVCKFLKDTAGAQFWLAEMTDRLQSIVEADKAEQYPSGDLQIMDSVGCSDVW